MRYLLLAIALVPLCPTLATAQSWEDWTRQNPTYGSPTREVAPAPSTTSPARIPARLPAPNPSELEFSTQNPERVRAGMQNCLREFGAHQQVFCGCLVRKLQDNFTFQQVLQINEDRGRNTANTLAFREKVVRPCLNYIVR